MINFNWEVYSLPSRPLYTPYSRPTIWTKVELQISEKLEMEGHRNQNPSRNGENLLGKKTRLVLHDHESGEKCCQFSVKDIVPFDYYNVWVEMDS